MVLTLFSLLYGPMIVWIMDAFSPTASSLIVLCVSLLLIALNIKEKSPIWIIPFVYFLISISTLLLDKSEWLRLGPLSISLGVALLFSLREKTHIMILNAINRWKFLRKKEFSTNQIKSNIVVWIAAAWVNVLLQVLFLMFAKKWLWAFYVSVGWYSVFVLAGVVHIYMWRRKKRVSERKDKT